MQEVSITDYFKDKHHFFKIDKNSPQVSMFDCVEEENIDENSINENSIAETFLHHLKADFIIQREVKGVHLSGKELRIDAILKPKETKGWLNPNITIGVEFKDPSKISSSQGRGEYDLLAQCLDYSMTDFEGVDNNSTIILICPGIASDKNDVYRFLSRYNIGYMDVSNDYGISMRMGHLGIPLWCSEKGAMRISKSYWRKTFGVRSNKQRYIKG